MRTDLSPAGGAFSVTPHNTEQQPKVTRGLYVGGAGNVKVTMVGGQELTFSAVPAGQILPIRVTHIWATGTTATLMIGLY